MLSTDAGRCNGVSVKLTDLTNTLTGTAIVNVDGAKVMDALDDGITSEIGTIELDVSTVCILSTRTASGFCSA